jgi:hypothetical protein
MPVPEGKLPEDSSSPLARFLRVYDNLPLEERLRVILVLDDEPISWRLARDYIVNSTEKGVVILKKLDQLQII